MRHLQQEERKRPDTELSGDHKELLITVKWVPITGRLGTGKTGDRPPLDVCKLLLQTGKCPT